MTTNSKSDFISLILVENLAKGQC